MPGESRFMIVEQPTTAVALDSTGDKKSLIIPQDCTVLEAGVITVAAMLTTALVLDFDRRVVPNSDTDRVNSGVARITSPTAVQAAGRTVYKAVQVDLNVGDEVVVEVVTATGTNATGVPYMIAVPRAAAPGDFADRVASS